MELGALSISWPSTDLIECSLLAQLYLAVHVEVRIALVTAEHKERTHKCAHQMSSDSTLSRLRTL